MKSRLANRGAVRGAALILALIFIAGIAILTMSALSLSRNEVKIASLDADGSRIDIAMTAGFEEAKNLLLNGVAGDQVPGSFKGDDYLVTAVREKGKGIDNSSRYTYILRPEGNAYRAIPLFAGGKEESFAINDGSDPFLAAPMRPKVEWESGGQPEEIIQLPPLTDLLPGGSNAKEYSHPKTVWKKVQPNPDRSATREERYTYWIEDLQGYPDISIVGNPGFDSGNNETSVNARSIAMRWGGYGTGESRSSQPMYALGKEQCLAPHDYQVAFPEILALRDPKTNQNTYQLLAGQVAPGLSPREIPFYPWRLQSGSSNLFDHPYGRLANIRANQAGVVSIGSLASLSPFEPDQVSQRSFDLNVEERFTLGLSGYREVPLVPPGFGYPDGAVGKPRRNLNEWIRKVEADPSPEVRKGALDELASYIGTMLPLFVERKGAFPEDYLKTIAASILDYADTDSMSTVENPVVTVPYQESNDKDAFRGIDSFPLCNEFFLKFTYDGYEPEGSRTRVHFKATPFVELWNPVNVPVSYEGLKLDFRFLEDFTVKVGADTRRKIENRLPDGPVALATEAGTLWANQYKVVRFADYEFSALVEMDEDDIGVPLIDELKAASDTNAEAHYELIWNGRTIDMSGRMGYHSGASGNPPDTEEGVHGFEITNYPNASFSADSSRTTGTQLLMGDFIMRFWASAMRSRVSYESTCYGDPRMAYYPRGQFYPLVYVNSATPGARNANRSAPSGREGYSDVVHLWGWPDGGYDTPLPTFNLAGPIDPDQVPATPVVGSMAPWRISNGGRYYSVTELGNIYDPVMWRPDFAPLGSSGRLVSDNLLARNHEVRESMVLSIGNGAKGGTPSERKMGSQEFGGGNSLRIGRLEHPKFDRIGLRASQLLDIFQVGTTGTNCEFLTKAGNGADITYAVDRSDRAYERFAPAVNQPPPAAPDADQAKQAPYRHIYPEDLHACSQMRWVHGQLNLNSVPTQFEMEALLRGCFASANIKWNSASGAAAEKPTGFVERQTAAEILGNSLNTNPAELDVKGRPRKTVGEVAQKLMMARPFRSPALLAAAVAQAVGPSEGETALLGEGATATAGKGSALPNWCSDALHEEPFARLLNATTSSSRHFRIYVRGEAVARRPERLEAMLSENAVKVVGRATKVYEVFLLPVRDGSGKIIATQLQVLTVRSL